MALASTLVDPRLEPIALFCTVDRQTARVLHHHVPEAVVRAQADALGLPIVVQRIPAHATPAAYGRLMTSALQGPLLRQARGFVFGDLFLEDLRSYRESKMAEANRRCHFPLWGRPTHDVVREFIGQGFRALVVSVDTRSLDEAHVGRFVDEQFLADLPPSVDPCGERGEFHTLVVDGPLFSRPIQVGLGATRRRGRISYADVELRHALTVPPDSGRQQPG
jgi:uncharacterized protein (TIGR00290 family)